MANTTTKPRHDDRERCPFCGRFVSPTADGFYDRLDRDNEESYVFAFCNEEHADRYHERKAACPR